VAGSVVWRVFGPTRDEVTEEWRRLHNEELIDLFYMGVKLGRLLREERRLRVFESSVLRRVFGPTRDEVTEEWRRLHNEELNDLYSSTSTVRVIKSGRMRWVGHVARMGRTEVYTGFWWVNLRERDHLGDLGIDGRIILRWFFRKWDVGVWTRLSCLKIGTGGRHL
jgi:hypothetical protein